MRVATLTIFVCSCTLPAPVLLPMRVPQLIPSGQVGDEQLRITAFAIPPERDQILAGKPTQLHVLSTPSIRRVEDPAAPNPLMAWRGWTYFRARTQPILPPGTFWIEVYN